jgi:hypothetical protein
VRAAFVPDHFRRSKGIEPITPTLRWCVDQGVALSLDFDSILAPPESEYAYAERRGRALAVSMAMLLFVHRTGTHKGTERIVPALSETLWFDDDLSATEKAIDLSLLVETNGASVVTVQSVMEQLMSSPYRHEKSCSFNLGRRRVVQLAMILHAHFPPYVIVEIFDWLPLSEFIPLAKKVEWVEGVVRSISKCKAS